jgi:hypothetical protein
MGNVLPESTIIYDDPQKRIVRVTVTDLEGNVTFSKDVVLEETVERRLKIGRREGCPPAVVFPANDTAARDHAPVA